ncbi:hypothetical protein MMC06_004130 [Schaereria dolodes]|nr:hypothetical protein [Schaereria dolodes]
MSLTAQRRTFDALIVAFNHMDIPAIMSFRSPVCTQKIHPLKSNPHPPQDNAAYLKRLSYIIKAFNNFHLEVHEVIEDTLQRKISAWLTAKGETKGAGEYNNEYMWVLEFDENGKVVKIKEFVDTLYQKEFFPNLRKVVEEQAKFGRPVPPS